MECVFCKIAKKEIKAEILFEDNEFIVFKDIKPSAPVHLLIVPKAHKFRSINDIRVEDKCMLGKMILIAKDMAEKSGIKSGYKLIFNVGREGGQIIDHLHLHLMGGWGKKIKI